MSGNRIFIVDSGDRYLPKISEENVLSITFSVNVTLSR